MLIYHDDDDDDNNNNTSPVRKLMAVTGAEVCLNTISDSSNSMLCITVRPSANPIATTFSSGDFYSNTNNNA